MISVSRPGLNSCGSRRLSSMTGTIQVIPGPTHFSFSNERMWGGGGTALDALGIGRR